LPAPLIEAALLAEAASEAEVEVTRRRNLADE
jgi:hypothetical protein